MQARTSLPHDAQSVGAARRFLTVACANWHVDPDVVDTARLLVSELVSNAVLHARTEMDLAVSTDGDGVRVAVSDANPRLVVRKRTTLTATTGRGLLLVDALAADWGVDDRDGGKTVWFMVRPGTEPQLLDGFGAFEDTA